MMGSKTRSLLHWVLFIVVVILPIYGSKGSALHPPIVSPPKVEAANLNRTATDSRPIISKEDPIGSLQLSALSLTPVSTPRRFPLNAPSIQPSFTGLAPSASQFAQNISFHGPAISPALVSSPANHGPTYGFPVAAPSKEMSSHLYPVNHSNRKGFSPAIAPASTEVKTTSNTSLRFTPTMSPMPLEGKQPSNITDAPLSSSPGLSRSSPVINPVPHDMKPPLNAHAPLPSHLQPSSSPHEGIEPSESPVPSHLHPSESSPAMSPAPNEVNNSSSASHSQPSRSSPALSPTPHEVKEPSNITDSPLPSSPPPHEVKEPSNSTHSPLPSHPLPLRSPPPLSPVQHEVTDPSINAHSPLASHPKSPILSPSTSPTPHVVKDPSNTTHSPLPSESSPAISPIPPEVTVPSNNTHAPLASPSKPSGSAPVISPIPPVVKERSDVMHSPFPSHPFPSVSPPVISPSSHVVKDSSNVTHAPLPSDTKPSRISPIISPIPPEVNPSNVTHSPLPSHLPPSEFSPVAAPPHEAKFPSNITHAPVASRPMPSQPSPAMSPTPHEFKDPSNGTLSPLPSHPLPSQSSPVISRTPHKREPSNITHSPFPSLPHPSEHSPAVSPMPRGMKNQSNATEAPLASHHHPSVSSPMLSPMPHEVKNPSNITHASVPSHITHAPVALHPMPSQPSPAMSPTPHEFKDPSNGTLSPLPSHPLPSQSSPVISRTPHERGPSNITHSPLPSLPHPSEHSPAVSPMPHGMKNQSNATEAPLASHRHPSVSSPLLSPMPHEVKNPSNITHASVPSHITHAPVALHPMPSQSSPAMSPTPHEFKDPSNGTLSPLPSHPLPSQSSPVISHTPHERGPSNITHLPLPSLPHPSEHSPAVSPMPHGMKNQSNATEAPLASHRRPSASSPLLSPMPHEVKNSSNITHAPMPLHITHAPLASRPMPSQSSPAMSPTQDPSNGTLSPLPSHPLPSQSSPVISPTPREREPSNITHSPLPSLPHPSEHSPAVSPMPHGVKNQSNATEAPLASHHHPSVASPLLSPMPHEVKNPSKITHAPMPLHHHAPPERIIQTPSVAPTISAPQPGANIRAGIPAFAPFSPSRRASHHPGPVISPTPSHKQMNGPSPDVQGPSISPIQAPSHPPSVVPKNNQRNHATSPYHQAPSHSPIRAPFPSANREIAHAPSPSMIPSRHNRWPIHPPILPPGFSGKRRTPPPQTVWAFPPPPPNLDCKRLSCKDPLTYPPPGSLCVCVSPIKVGLRLSIALYTFFPLVSELAQAIASGIFVKQSQVRIMGANAASEDSEKTIVLIDIVPLGRSFDMNTAFLIFDRFWHKQVPIKASYFGDYDVLYVLYPGLPPSPPMAPGESVDDGTLANQENARRMKPLGVDVGKRKEKLSGSLIAVIILSSVMAIVISVGAAWLLLLKCRNRSSQPPPTLQPPLPLAKPSGSGGATLGSGPSSTSASFTSSIPAHTGSAKTFSLAEVERATDRFHDSRIIGEGGFGRVYQGTLDDGIMVAVKVLKRDDHQGGREFLAEVEMLSRLHHRNLVKLIGICTEENVRCLVYELIPNGSVESHLHGLDKETSPLDWNARMKIALGAARGLAYLHEDSSPRVIHRDFKSSNILLEHDFTPKVSDFGLARTALDEGNGHISTRVMGTFGYVAPEYAMTGHLLVKSDVYSYGVVLLELLTGRKPIDMTQPPGQENLVSWARPLLTSMDGLEKLIDPALSASISLDTVAKVAAIASMCVQPEVSHRPFMGEVVQALKLVCNESDEHRRSCSHESSTKDSDIRISTGSGVQDERMPSESDIFCTSAMFANDASGSFRRYSSSGPLKMGKSQMFCGGERRFSSGSMTESGAAHRYNEEQWPWGRIQFM